MEELEQPPEQYIVERVVCECEEKPCKCYRFVVMKGDEGLYLTMKYNDANNFVKSLYHKRSKEIV